MNPSALEQCFRQLGSALGDDETAALVNLAARIDADGVVALGPDGPEFDKVLELRRGELGWAQLQCTIEPRPGGPKAAFVRPLVQLLRSLPPLQDAGFVVADGLGRVLRNALAQVPNAATWHIDIRGG